MAMAQDRLTPWKRDVHSVGWLAGRLDRRPFFRQACLALLFHIVGLASQSRAQIWRRRRDAAHDGGHPSRLAGKVAIANVLDCRVVVRARELDEELRPELRQCGWGKEDISHQSPIASRQSTDDC